MILVELTMGLLARSSCSSSGQRPGARRGSGYIAEFLDLVLAPHLDMIVEKNIKVVTNAGGLYPLGLKHAIEAHVNQRGLGGKVHVAAITGDDLLTEQSNISHPESIKGFDPLSGAGR